MFINHGQIKLERGTLTMFSAVYETRLLVRESFLAPTKRERIHVPAIRDYVSVGKLFIPRSYLLQRASFNAIRRGVDLPAGILHISLSYRNDVSRLLPATRGIRYTLAHQA